MAPHSSTLAWKIPWTEEHGGLQSMGSQRIGHDWVTSLSLYFPNVKVAQSCLTLCDPMDYTIHGILQVRIPEWVAFPFSRGSLQPMDRTQVSRIAGRLFTSWATQQHNYILPALFLSFSSLAAPYSGTEVSSPPPWVPIPPPDQSPVALSQFSSVAQSCLTLCDPMNCSTPGLPVHHQLLESTQTHGHQVGDAIQPSLPLPSPSPPAPNPSQHQGLFQWVNSSHEVAKILEFQL